MWNAVKFNQANKTSLRNIPAGAGRTQPGHIEQTPRSVHVVNARRTDSRSLISTVKNNLFVLCLQAVELFYIVYQ